MIADRHQQREMSKIRREWKEKLVKKFPCKLPRKEGDQLERKDNMERRK